MIESDHLRVVCKGEVVIDKLLFAYINTLKSSYDIRKTKIEIVLCKEEQGIWPTIEGDASARPRVVKSDSGVCVCVMWGGGIRENACMCPYLYVFSLFSFLLPLFLFLCLFHPLPSPLSPFSLHPLPLPSSLLHSLHSTIRF